MVSARDQVIRAHAKRRIAAGETPVRVVTLNDKALVWDSPTETLMYVPISQLLALGVSITPTVIVPGPPGATGPTGPAGAAGSSGPSGPSGSAGSTGPTGPAGPVGATGPPGAMGVQGIVGATGPAGSPGLVGATGATGPFGPPGMVGATGATGPAGATGPTPGPAADVANPGNGLAQVRARLIDLLDSLRDAGILV